MSKRICHVLFSEFPKDSRIRRFSNALLNEQYKVFVVCLRDAGQSIFERNGNLFIYRIPMKKNRGSFASRAFEYLLFQVLATIMVSYLTLRHNIKIFHVSTLPDFLVFSCIVPKLLGYKIILDFHELFPEFMMQHKPSLNYSSSLIKFLLFQERNSFKFASEVLIFHEPARKILSARVHSKKSITIVMNGVDTSEIPEFKRQSIDEFRLVYNGTINYNLNLQLVVKALAHIRNSDPTAYNNIKFHLYGDGPDLPNILSQAKALDLKNIIYEGQFKFMDMIKELEKASICILPPKKDIYSDLFYSLKLTEMIFLKIPVIATNLNTYKYYFPAGLVYFNSDDHIDLAEKILNAYKNRDELICYSEKAFSEYQNVRWEIMIKRYTDLVNSVTAKILPEWEHQGI